MNSFSAFWLQFSYPPHTHTLITSTLIPSVGSSKVLVDDLNVVLKHNHLAKLKNSALEHLHNTSTDFLG